MQLFAVIGLSLVIIYLSWVKPRYLREPVPTKAIIALSIVLVVLGASEARWQYLQWRGSEVVRAVSGNPAGKLECQRFLPSLVDMDSASLRGTVSGENPNVAVLKHKQCNDFFGWVQGGNPDTIKVDHLIALHVLTHESVHVSGEFSENITECTAIQRDPITIQTLGGSKEMGELLQLKYFENIYPRLSENYKLDGCEINPKFDSIETPLSSE